MNFEALNWLINSILRSHKCGFCKNKPKKEDINIKNINWSEVFLEINCPKCQKTSYIKTEVMEIDLKKYLTENQLNELKWKIFSKKSNNKISKGEISKLTQDLKKENLNVSDLFKNI